jgi:hypothetical protein
MCSAISLVNKRFLFSWRKFMNQKVCDAAMSQPTWNESNSFLAQVDMRRRCAVAAATVAAQEISQLTARIAELERQLAATRPAPHMAILQTPQHDPLWA